MGAITLITGGSRSGKSAHAIALATAVAGAGQRFFIATAQALDSEMRSRIAHHRATRPADFHTIEEPLDPIAALRACEQRADLAVPNIAVIDCLTLWVSNLIGAGMDDETIIAAVDALAAALGRVSFATVIVTGEVGSGIVPEHPVARRFRDLLGWTNQKIARAADAVILMTAGYPLRIK